MTQEQDQKFPRRIWLGEACDEWALSPGKFSEEYISIQEHKALLEAARRKARAEVWEECAPELLEAAKLALANAESYIHDQYDGTSFLYDRLSELEPVRAAIAKAEGKDDMVITLPEGMKIDLAKIEAMDKPKEEG